MGVLRDMKKVILAGPIFSRSGYGEHVRCVYRALEKHPDKYDIYIKPTNWGQTSWSYNNKTEENEIIEHCIKKTQMYQGEYDVSLQVLIPNEWTNMAKVNIGVTAGIETNKASAKWIYHCNFMDKVIVISKHSKESFEKPTYQTQDEHGNPTGVLKCTVPIDVIGYPVKEKLLKSTKDLGLDIETDFNFLTVAQAGPRKALHETLIWFAEQFKDDASVGLIVKSNKINNSVMDRKHMKQSIIEMLKPVKDRKCKIYLLHGNLMEEELHSLYSHDKIHAYITTTRGEGYGLPIFEAAYSGMPVVAPAWSGHVDFLYMPVTNSKSKKVKKMPMFLKTRFKLAPVNSDAVWEDVIDADSLWCYSDEKSFKKNLKNMRESYQYNKKQALQLQDYLRKEFHEDVIHQKYHDSIEDVAPDDRVDIENWLQEIGNNMEEYE